MPKRLLLLSAVAFVLVYWGASAKCVAEEADVGEALYAQHRLSITYIEADDWTKADAAFQELVTKYADHPGIAEAVYYVADEYGDAKKYDKAREAYQYVVDHWPQADYAIRAQVAVVRSSILLEDEAGAKAATDSLLAKFSASKDLPKAVDHAADAYRHAGKYKEAREIYRYIVQKWPEAEHAMESQRGVVLSSVRMGDDANAASELEKLINDFADNENIARAVCDVADEYRELGRYDEALANYGYVVRTWPETEHAMEAQSGAVLTNILLKDDSAADTAFSVLISKYSKSEDIEEIVKEIADECTSLKKYGKAIQLYQYMLGSWPQHEEAIWLQTELAYLNIAQGDYGAAHAAVNSLTASFSEHPDLPDALHEIGKRYERVGKYNEARSIYTQVVEQHPQSADADDARLGIARVGILSYISDENNTAASEALDALIADFNDHRGLPRAVFLVAEKYYLKAFQLKNDGLAGQAQENFQKARTVWETLINRFPSSGYVPKAYRLSGYCYRLLGQYERAIEYFQKVAADWPDYRYAWDAQFQIGYCYEQLKNKGAMAKSEADPRIKAAYGRLLEKYPTCKVAEIARRWLTSHESK